MFRPFNALGAIALLGATMLAQEQAQPTPPVHSPDIAVVVNLKNPAVRLSLSDLRKIFAGEKSTWPGGIPVKLIIRAPQAREREAVLHLLNLSEAEFNRYWAVQAHRSQADEPVAVYSNGMQKEAVMAFPGAIALIAADDVRPGVKLLKIDDRLPREEGYPLR